MILQHSSVRKSLHRQVITIILFNAKLGIFQHGYVVILPFIYLVSLLFIARIPNLLFLSWVLVMIINYLEGFF